MIHKCAILTVVVLCCRVACACVVVGLLALASGCTPAVPAQRQAVPEYLVGKVNDAVRGGDPVSAGRLMQDIGAPDDVVDWTALPRRLEMAGLKKSTIEHCRHTIAVCLGYGDARSVPAEARVWLYEWADPVQDYVADWPSDTPGPHHSIWFVISEYRVLGAGLFARP
jgi:hypothetical protein